VREEVGVMLIERSWLKARRGMAGF